MAAKKQLRLGAFMRPVSIHTAAWRYPGGTPEANFDLGHITRYAQTLERGLFDAFFMADHLAVLNMPMEALKRSATVTSFDPLTLLPALAMVTKHLGLIATASTTFEPPYVVARRFASLDHISGGRAAWNLVTTSNPDAARNFGFTEQMEHGERYRRAREYYDVVTGLWDSWADDAFPRDVESGIFFDPERLHVLDHEGEFFSVRGPLNIARPVQGLAGDRAGGRFGGRPPAGGGDGGDDLRLPRQPRRRPALLRRRQGPDGGVGARSRPSENPAGRPRRRRRQRRGGAGKTRPTRQPGA